MTESSRNIRSRFYSHDKDSCHFQTKYGRATSIQMFIGGSAPVDLYICKREISMNQSSFDCFICTVEAVESIFNELNRDFPGLRERLNRELSGADQGAAPLEEQCQ